MKKKWNDVGQKLVELGVLCSADMDSLAALIQLFFVAEDAWTSIADQGAVIWVETANGKKPVQNPSFRVYMDAQKALKPLLEQFGMTPKSRQGIKVNQKAAADPLEEFMKATRGGKAKEDAA